MTALTTIDRDDVRTRAALVALLVGTTTFALARATMTAGAVLATAAVTLFAFLHGSLPVVVAWSLTLYAGLGLMWAAIPILILQDVPATRSGEATGLNTIIRYLGSGIGTQVAATFLTASSAGQASILPTETGYRTTLVALAIGGLAATIATLSIPGRGVFGVAGVDVAPVTPAP